METVRLEAHPRETSGKGPARRMRAAGEVPAVVYGHGQETRSVSIGTQALRDALHGGNNVVLELHYPKDRGRKHHAVIKEIQRHPTRHQIIHIDLQEVSLKEDIEAPVPVEIVGTPKGAVDGGILDHQRHEVHVRALPTKVPSGLSLDVSALGVGDYARVADLIAPDGVTILEDAETVLVAILAPRVIAVAAGEEEGGEVSEAPTEGETEANEE